MENKLYIYESRSFDPYYNLALEEYLTKSVGSGVRILFLWQNESTVVIGKNQNTGVECNAEAAKREGVHIARRLSGGGAVFHDHGNLCFSFISHEKTYDTALHCEVIRRACASFGIDAALTGRNDILADGRKFSGNAFYSVGKNHCHHGTVLLATDTNRLQKYLTTPKSKLTSKGIPSVRSAVVNLRELCPQINRDSFFEAMKKSAADVFGTNYTEKETPDAALFADRQAFLASDEWIFDEDPPFTDELDVKTSAARFNIKVNVKNARIESCAVFTDSLDTAAAEKLQKALVGTPFSEEHVIKIVQNSECRMQS